MLINSNSDKRGALKNHAIIRQVYVFVDFKSRLSVSFVVDLVS